MTDVPLEVVLLGTGCPSVSTERYGAGTLVRAGGMSLLFDVGSGVTQRLAGAGTRSAAVDALFITHIHSDHLMDLYQFVISSWHGGRMRGHRIFGPPGTRDFVDAMMEAWAGERALRIAHERRTSVAAFELEVIEFDAGGVLIEEADARVSAVLVDHAPVVPAFGFVIEAGGRRAVISGDTVRSPNLVRAAQGADLLVHEVFVHGAMKPTGNRTEDGLRAVESYHTLSTEVGLVAREAGVRCLVLSHIVPPDADRKRMLADARAEFAGPVVVGEDLMRIDAVAGVVSWGAARMAVF